MKKFYWLLVLPWTVHVSTSGSCGPGCLTLEGVYVSYNHEIQMRVENEEAGEDLAAALNEAHERRTATRVNGNSKWITTTTDTVETYPVRHPVNYDKLCGGSCAEDSK